MVDFEKKDFKFEIPNNMDINLPSQIYNLLKINNVSTDIIQSFYTPLYWEDGLGSIRLEKDYDYLNTISWEKYNDIIKEINHYFPGKVQLLIQNNTILPTETLQKYIEMGIFRFCVGNYQQAKNIREKLPGAEIFASITMGVHDYDLIDHPEYKEVFDGIVLPFQYARKLKAVNNLPLGFKYIMISNTTCSCFCVGKHHWGAPIIDGNQFSPYCCRDDFLRREFVPLMSCENNKVDYHTFSSLILPQDFHLFTTISIWKILDRNHCTNDILNFLREYIKILIQGVKPGFSCDIDYNSYYKYVKQYNQYIRDHNLPHDIMPEE